MYGPQAIFQLVAPHSADLTTVFINEFARTGLSIEELRTFVDHSTGEAFFRVVTTAPENMTRCMLQMPAVLDRCTQTAVNYTGQEKIVLLATRERHCLEDLLWRHSEGRLGAEILGVVSNYDDLGDLVSRYGIPFHCVPVPKHEGSLSNQLRAEHEEQVTEVVKDLSGIWPAWIGLAKYMQVLCGPLLEACSGRIVNIHHGLLPSFKGANPYKQAWEKGVKIIGATAHLVVKDLDEGPIIVQDVVPVNHAQGWEDMRELGRYVETRVFAYALRQIFERRVFVNARGTTILL